MFRARNEQVASMGDRTMPERRRSAIADTVRQITSKVDAVLADPERREQEIKDTYESFRKQIKNPTIAVEELEQLLAEQHNAIVDNYSRTINEWKQKSPALKASVTDAQSSLDKAAENLNHVKSSFDVTAEEVYGSDETYNSLA